MANKIMDLVKKVREKNPIKKQKKKLSEIVKKKNVLISWEAPEFIYYKKNTYWYIALIGVSLLFAAFFFWQDNWSAFVLVIVAAIVLFLMASQKPKKKKYTISEKGFYIDDKFYPAKDFKSFYITYTGKIANLHFEKTDKLSLPMSAIIQNVDQKMVYSIIKKMLPENTKIKSTYADTLNEWIKF